MNDTHKMFTYPQIAELEALLEAGYQRERSVLELLNRLTSATETERQAAERYAETLEEADGIALEDAATSRIRMESRINSLAEAHDCEEGVESIQYIARKAQETVTLSAQATELWVDIYNARAIAAELLIEPANRGLMDRLGSLLSGNRQSASEAFKAASENSAEGKFLKAITRLAQNLRSSAASVRSGHFRPTKRTLAGLKEPLPNLSNFKK